MSKKIKNEIRYFIIKKKNEVSMIQDYPENKIKTTYEMLWQNLRENKDVPNALNTMRRILEHYFTLTGGLDYEKCINEIQGNDKIILKSLVALINDGSHSVFDNLDFSFDDFNFDNYMRVFRSLFEKLGHIQHYDMMMNQ